MRETPGQVNRFTIAALALAVIFCALLAVLLAWGASEGSIERLRDLAGFLERHNDRDGKIILTLGATVVMLVMASILVLELNDAPMPRMRVRNVTAGDVTITTARIGEHIDDAVQAVPHVADSRTAVTRRGRKVDIVLDLHVDAGADLASTADAACRTAHTLVERLGIELAAMPRARLHYRELRLQSNVTESSEQASVEGQGAT